MLRWLTAEGHKLLPTLNHDGIPIGQVDLKDETAPLFSIPDGYQIGQDGEVPSRVA